MDHIWSLLVDSSNSLTVTAIGFLITSIGFIITVSGFVVAIWRLRKLETLAIAANNAVVNFKLRISRYDAAADATEARYALGSTRRHLDNDGWRDVGETYDDVRRAALRIRDALGVEDHDSVESLNKMMVQIAKLCRLIDVATVDPEKAFPDKVRTRSMIRSHVDLISNIRQTLAERAL